MSPTSRNTLLIGGALIAIALLLVCGPLSDRFGRRGGDDQEPPAVAAGPPPDAVGAAGAAALGGLAGATAGGIGEAVLAEAGDPCRPVIEGESEADREKRLRDHGCLTPAASETAGGAASIAAATTAGVAGEAGAEDESGDAVAGLEDAGNGNAAGAEAVVGLAGTTAAVAAGGSAAGTAGAGASAGASGASATDSGIAAAEGVADATPLPPVSAGLRRAGEAAAADAAALATGGVGAGVGALATATPALAAAAFDDALASTGSSGGGVGPAGPVVRRFPPPVAALGASPSVLASAQPFIDSSSPVVLPCDSPGSGCANIRPPLNPPFVPGRRPPLSDD
ncbi:MAG TPA: hypothetical protein ENI85_11010 [Deltaproteobacteria bacterium]|nr:hypothetical protein [Deltaproteobacteria bacterium]